MRFRNTAESEWRSKYEYACEEVRELKARLSATKEVTGVENSRLKVRGGGDDRVTDIGEMIG